MNPPQLEHLVETDWQERRRRHEARVLAFTAGHRARAARGEKHPVEDFLFHYYAFRPAWLQQWHPGPDVVLTGPAAREFLRWPEYEVQSVEGRDGIALNVRALPAHRHEFVRWLQQLLTSVQARPGFFGCFGLHEWAMVYRQSAEEVRHNAWPLRFAPERIAAIVESMPLCCSHFDAFRFFTAPARPLNRLQPTRQASLELEQGGCLHANMDLYKWAFKLAPFTPAELTADCFELARDIRTLDMQASPYDLLALGLPPVPIETAEGRATYEQRQRTFSERARPLRARLIALCERLLA
jgi:hypothetical protein